ncbi:MAG: hypothetical protein ACREDV_06395, partial [Methylocella sp.]
ASPKTLGAAAFAGDEALRSRIDEGPPKPAPTGLFRSNRDQSLRHNEFLRKPYRIIGLGLLQSSPY